MHVIYKEGELPPIIEYMYSQYTCNRRGVYVVTMYWQGEIISEVRWMFIFIVSTLDLQCMNQVDGDKDGTVRYL